jgi:hypothetical protein
MIIFITYKTLWEPPTVKWALPNWHSPQQLQRPLGCALPGDNWWQTYKNAFLWYDSISYSYTYIKTATQQRVYSARNHQLVTAVWVLPAAMLSLALASLHYKSLARPPTQIRQAAPSHRPPKTACCARRFAGIWHTHWVNPSHQLPCTLLACSSVYSVNRRTFVIVLGGCLFKHQHPTTLYNAWQRRKDKEDNIILKCIKHKVMRHHFK